MDQNQQMVKSGNGAMVSREEFGAQSLASTGNTAAEVLAMREKATVEARFIIAMKRPRDWDEVRQGLLKACERPGFAGSATEKIWGAAWYRKPIGEGVEGFSIRFAEEAIRCMGNMDARSAVIWEDDTKRLVEVSVLDLQSNISIPTTIVVDKTIERKKLRRGETAISSRINSYGEVIYLRQATDDEILQKQASLISKAMRNGILRLLPGDIQAECRDRILQIRHGDMAKDPDAYRRKISDGFAKLGVTPGELKKYIGHELSSCSPSELSALRDLWKEIDEGKTTWADVVMVDGDEEEPAEPPKKSIAKLTDKLKNTETKKAVTVDQATVEKTSEPGVAVDDLVDIARSIWGGAYLEPLKHACDCNNCTLYTLTDAQLSMMMDLLHQQKEGM